jgi:hypothetical protein
MIYKIRVVLDVKEDVIRTIAIDSKSTLEELHHTITNVFGFNGQQMASFYRTDEDWNQGEEIPLINMDNSPGALSMATTSIEQNIEDEGEKLIYVYDFLEMWTFFVEIVEVSKYSEDKLPKLVLTIGDVPEKAPEKEFKADKESGSDDPYDFDDEFNEFGEHQNLDDLDTDLY